jgi:hypothetical protein
MSSFQTDKNSRQELKFVKINGNLFKARIQQGPSIQTLVYSLESGKIFNFGHT